MWCNNNYYSWFENYFANRKQCVVINDKEDMSIQDIIYGVPQESALGLLLFIYLLPKKISSSLDSIVFTDDTSLFISDKNIINALVTKVNLELQKLNEWFQVNKLSLNTKISTFYI